MKDMLIAGILTAILVYGLIIGLSTIQMNEQELIAAQEVTTGEHVTQLVIDPEGEMFDPYQMPEPLAWQPQFRCRLQEGIDGYGRIVAPVAVVPFTPTVATAIEVHWDTDNLSGQYSVACRLELANWMGNVRVFALGDNADVALQTVDGIGLKIVETFTVAGEPVYLPIIFRNFAQ